MSIRIKPFIYSILITLGAGILSAIITGNSTDVYSVMNKPPLSPPSWVFPVAWTILYTLMGIAAGIVMNTNCKDKATAIKYYALQLIVNILWPIIFFTAKLYLLAFLWILLLDVLVVITIFKFYNCNKKSAYLLLPYLVWLIFATYLNLGVVILNP